MRNKLGRLMFLFSIGLCLFSGCIENKTTHSSSIEVTSISVTTESYISSITTSTVSVTTLSATTSTSLVTTLAEEITTVIEPQIQPTAFSIEAVPEYSGMPYAEINDNKPFFTDYPTNSFEYYSPLDDLGRCGTAFANVSIEIMPTEPRGEIGAIKPSGWQTANYSGIIDDIYLYNRCHLIGYQLAGENANVLNLITGTRYMNIEGMQPFENKVANYVKSYNAHVLYRVTPVFEGNNLVASGVLMEAYSLDDNGAGIQFCVYCYNVQPNIGINYADGSSWSLIQETEPLLTEQADSIPEKNIPIEDYPTYILNTNTKKFHFPSCSSVDSMKDKNKLEYTGTRDDVIAMGYEPCKRFNP